MTNVKKKRIKKLEKRLAAVERGFERVHERNDTLTKIVTNAAKRDKARRGG